MSSEGDALAGDGFPGSLHRRPSGSWRWRVSIDGERQSETWSADLDDEEVKRKARERYNALQARVARGDGVSVRLSRLIAVYRDTHLPTLADSSRADYGRALDSLEAYYGDRDPTLSSLSRGDVKSFLSWRRVHKPDGGKRSEPLSGHTLQQTRAVLSGMFEEAREREWIAGNPARGISVDAAEREPVILSEAEYEALLKTVESRPMLRMLVLLGGEAGLRRSEAGDLRWTGVDLGGGFLEVVHGRDGRTTKGKKSRSVPMTARLRSELRDHAARFRLDGTGSEYVLHHRRTIGKAEPGDPFAQTLKHALLKAAEKAELPEEWRYHDLRHRRCTLWLSEGYSPEKVRRAMGHAKLETTLRYSHLVRSDLEEMVGEDDRAELGDMVG